MENSLKNSWTNQSGYIWSLIGSAVGFANILSFSAKAYFYGGGAFLVPFIMAILILGIPLLCLEGIIGQYFQLPLVPAYAKAVGRMGKFFGWLSILSVITIGGYYLLLTGWTLSYGYFIAADLIPLNTDTFLNEQFLHKSKHIFEWGNFSYFMFTCMLLVGLFSWYVVSRDIKSGIERLCSFFLPILTITITIFALITAFLPGSWNGFAYYLVPNFSVLHSPRLWLDAFGHIFFSLSLGLGIVTGYSRHTDKSFNIIHSMLFVVLGDFLISSIAGFAVFGCIGYMSHIQNIPFTSLIRSSSPFEIGFVVFPTILKTFGSYLYPIFGLLFFFCIFIAGITGVFSIIESAAGNIEVEFKKTRSVAVTITTGIMILLASIFCMGNGQYIIGAIDPMVSGFNMLISGIAEIVCFIWISSTIQKNKIWFSQKGNLSFLYYCIKYIVPILLILVFGISLVEEFSNPLTHAKMIRWGWLAMATVVSMVLSLKK